MQESLLSTVQKLKSEPKIDIEQLELYLNSDIEEVVALCKKACLKPKTDSEGKAYFTKKDVDMLKKMKELYSQSQEFQNRNGVIDIAPKKVPKQEVEPQELDNPNKKINFLARAKNRIKNEVAPIPNAQSLQIQESLKTFENSIVEKMSAILSEKMDGFDEIIVELIRAKTENENLRQQVNTLNKQLFILKNELASFNPLPFGLYTKKEVDEP